MISSKEIRINIISKIWNWDIPYSLKFPMMIFIKYLRRKRPMGTQFFRQIICTVEYVKYKFFSNSRNIITVYDFNDSPPTLGDFIAWLMLVRYFQKKEKKITLFIIDELENPKINEIHKKLVKVICGDAEITYFQNIDLLSREIDSVKNFLIFKRKVLKSRRAGTHYFNFVNLLCKKQNDDFYNKFLLKDLGQAKAVESYGIKGYVVLHLRYTPPSSENYLLEAIRNTSEGDFIKLISSLKEKYPKEKILIVSDKLGSNFYKEISIEHNLGCFFSKDYLDDFIFDCQLVLNSNAYFQINGGGMCAMAFFSKIPYLICAQITTTEYYVTKSKKNYWSSPVQIFREICVDEEFYYHLSYFNNLD